MKNGTCPECGSTQVYVGKGTESQGLRDEHSIHLAIDGLNTLYLETYVCANCGYVRAFALDQDLAQIRAGIGKSKPWNKVS
jgi:ribosomal protein L37E